MIQKNLNTSCIFLRTGITITMCSLCRPATRDQRKKQVTLLVFLHLTIGFPNCVFQMILATKCLTYRKHCKHLN